LAEKLCEVFALEAAGFRDLISNHPKLLPLTKYYAHVFANHICSAGQDGLTDIWMNIEELNKMVHESWSSVLHKLCPEKSTEPSSPPLRHSGSQSSVRKNSQRFSGSC